MISLIFGQSLNSTLRGTLDMMLGGVRNVQFLKRMINYKLPEAFGISSLEGYVYTEAPGVLLSSGRHTHASSD